MREAMCVGALILNSEGRVFIQHRTATRRVLPGTWDIVGGHIEPGETPEEALAREIEEETGWELRRVVACVADWEWVHDGVVRRELDFVVEVDGDLAFPRLEEEKHDAYRWVGVNELDVMVEGRKDGDHRLRDVVAAGVQFGE